jgi:repressor LexA
MALTRRQREIYDYVCDFVANRGYSPSLEEIGKRFGLTSVATVHKHIQHLVDKGYLQKAWNRSRSVEPVPREDGAAGVCLLPILGSVAAGQPIEAVEEGERVAVPETLRGRASDCFVLRVRGESMIEDQIADGDMVVVEKRAEARNGETVVAMIDGSEATLKRFYRKGPVVKLVPANATMKPIELPAERVQIAGVIKGLLRQY